MVLIHLDGQREEIAREINGLLEAEEIIGALGSRWRIVGQNSRVKWLACIHHVEQNMAASLLVGQMVFGPVLECVRGKEII